MSAIRLTQLDGKLPNLALMRLSSWHKERGDSVVFSRSPYRQLDEPEYRAVYGSTIFKFTEKRTAAFLREFPEAIVGGTGAGDRITVEQVTGDGSGAHDYSLYPDFRASIGFTQRGCRLKCKFCVVPEKEGKNRAVASIYDIWRGEPWPRHLHLLDNDFFGQPAEQWRERVREIRDGGFKVCLNQGINVRLIDEEGARALASLQYRDDSFSERRVYTAWDNLKDEGVFFRGIDTMKRAGIPPSHIMAYMLVGFAKDETMERVLYRFNRMVELGIRPYPMVYDRSNRTLVQFQRWAVTGLYRACSWAEYVPNARAADLRRDERQSDMFAEAT